MLSNKFLIMSFALFAMIIAISAQSSEEKISDRRFRWLGSMKQEKDPPEGEESDNAKEPEAEKEGENANNSGAEDDGNEQEEKPLKEADNKSARKDA